MIVHTSPATDKTITYTYTFSGTDFEQIIKNNRITVRIKNIYIRSRNRNNKKTYGTPKNL